MDWSPPVSQPSPASPSPHFQLKLGKPQPTACTPSFLSLPSCRQQGNFWGELGREAVGRLLSWISSKLKLDSWPPLCLTQVRAGHAHLSEPHGGCLGHLGHTGHRMATSRPGHAAFSHPKTMSLHQHNCAMQPISCFSLSTHLLTTPTRICTHCLFRRCQGRVYKAKF